MEIIFQISGHPKVGKKTMPGLIASSHESKGRDFQKVIPGQPPAFSRPYDNLPGRSRLCCITLIWIDLQGLCDLKINFDTSVDSVGLLTQRFRAEAVGWPSNQEAFIDILLFQQDKTELAFSNRFSGR